MPPVNKVAPADTASSTCEWTSSRCSLVIMEDKAEEKSKAEVMGRFLEYSTNRSVNSTRIASST